MSSSSGIPRAFRKIDTETFRFLSTLTEIISLGLVSNSSQAPLEGITLAKHRLRSEATFFSCTKYAPGDRTNWLTTTLSAPFMMKVPLGVILGISPMKISCSLISPVSKKTSLVFTYKG
ncbi:MAG: Uncharacterised protein [Chloroflexota bacterium]|nr:MAG: Uncharacterised protein [Chloroflexota bacterium]